MSNDSFTSRLDEEPDERYLTNLREPEFEFLTRHFFEPLLLLGRSHVVMLAEQDLLGTAEAGAILGTLDEMEAEGCETASGREFEDLHFWMEDHLVDSLGSDTGGKLQTGRSRTDLYDAAVRVVLREDLLDLLDAVAVLRAAVQDRAEETTDVVTTAYTHSKPAQPITLAHYFLAFDHLLERDFERVRRAYERTNRNPLGTAVAGGTGFDVDRERLSELAGFDGLVYNTYDSIASMDFVPEATFGAALLMTNVSRIARDLIDWATYEYGYLEVSDGFASVSSMMPQKKNPYALEKLRTEASDTIGATTSSLTHLKGAPFGDVSEVAKYAFVPLVEQIDEIVRCVDLLAGVVETTGIDDERMYDNATRNYSTMTELADTLVRECDISFRQAHEVVGSLVRTKVAEDEPATEITLEELRAAYGSVVGGSLPLTREQLEAALDPRENVVRRDVVGGTAPARNVQDLDRQRDRLGEQRRWLETARNALSESRREREERTVELRESA